MTKTLTKGAGHYQSKCKHEWREVQWQWRCHWHRHNLSDEKWQQRDAKCVEDGQHAPTEESQLKKWQLLMIAITTILNSWTRVMPKNLDKGNGHYLLNCKYYWLEIHWHWQWHCHSLSVEECQQKRYGMWWGWSCLCTKSTKNKQTNKVSPSKSDNTDMTVADDGHQHQLQTLRQE